MKIITSGALALLLLTGCATTVPEKPADVFFQRLKLFIWCNKVRDW